MIDGKLEDRHTRTKGQGSKSIPMAKVRHTEKSKKAEKTHKKWVESLPEGTVSMYTDGSKMGNGDTGCGWVIYRTSGGRTTTITEGFCHLGEKAEVIDAELHAVCEGLRTLLEVTVSTTTTYICVDNTSAITNLKANTNNSQYARQAIEVAGILEEKGWDLQTLWTPSHCNIAGNEKADELAKKGADDREGKGKCPDSCITKCWMMAEAKRTFHRNWARELPEATCSMKAPSHYDHLTHQQTGAVLRIYAGRTATDGLRNADPVPCRCEMANLSANHILTECRLMDVARREIAKAFPKGEQLTSSIAIQPKYVTLVSNFARKTGLGYRSELRYDQPEDASPNTTQEDPTDESEDDSTFGSQFGDFE